MYVECYQWNKWARDRSRNLCLIKQKRIILKVKMTSGMVELINNNCLVFMQTSSIGFCHILQKGLLLNSAWPFELSHLRVYYPFFHLIHHFLYPARPELYILCSDWQRRLLVWLRKCWFSATMKKKKPIPPYFLLPELYATACKLRLQECVVCAMHLHVAATGSIGALMIWEELL